VDAENDELSGLPFHCDLGRFDAEKFNVGREESCFDYFVHDIMCCD